MILLLSILSLALSSEVLVDFNNPDYMTDHYKTVNAGVGDTIRIIGLENTADFNSRYYAKRYNGSYWPTVSNV